MPSMAGWHYFSESRQFATMLPEYACGRRWGGEVTMAGSREGWREEACSEMVEERGGRPARRQQAAIKVQLNLEETIVHLQIWVSVTPCGWGGVCWVVVNSDICGTAVRRATLMSSIHSLWCLVNYTQWIFLTGNYTAWLMMPGTQSTTTNAKIRYLASWGGE